MSLTYSQSPKIGMRCPSFSLESVDEKVYSLEDFTKSKGLLVMFICNHCPYVQAIEDRYIALAKAFSTNDLQVVGVCSNNWQDYEEDSPQRLFERWQEKSYGFPYLIDENQQVAKAFGAVCTPDLFLFGADRKLYYHGRLDDNWQNRNKVNQQDLKVAVQMLLKNQPPSQNQEPSVGCSIKWK